MSALKHAVAALVLGLSATAVAAQSTEQNTPRAGTTPEAPAQNNVTPPVDPATKAKPLPQATTSEQTNITTQGSAPTGVDVPGGNVPQAAGKTPEATVPSTSRQ